MFVTQPKIAQNIVDMATTNRLQAHRLEFKGGWKREKEESSNQVNDTSWIIQEKVHRGRVLSCIFSLEMARCRYV